MCNGGDGGGGNGGGGEGDQDVLTDEQFRCLRDQGAARTVEVLNGCAGVNFTDVSV